MTPPAPAPDHTALRPSSPPGLVVLTFDNLGEASELERRTARPGRPPGTHPSVTVALPRLLRELAALDLTATFFVEAINCELNPAALDAIAAAGHEIGVHGWRHEQWGDLDPGRERALLTRAGEAFAARGLPTRAFRPPGGELTADTLSLLAELGYRWCSPAGTGPGGGVPPEAGGVHPGAGAAPGDRIAVVPFDWELVDAYHLMDSFTELRAERGAPPAPATPAAVADRLITGLTAAAGVRTVILHPFLMLDDAWREGAQRVLTAIAELARTGVARAASGPVSPR
jgi:peptidoglycan-N-acetylglucosamine deacetylase